MPLPRLLATAALVAGLAGAVLLPNLKFPATTAGKLVWLASLCLAWTGLITLCWPSRRFRALLLALPAIALGVLFWPSPPIAQDALRDAYIRELRKFEGTPYVWGGENRQGIDCSGLPRRALRNALIQYGFQHANSRALRLAIAQWWFDASARALANGHRQSTVPLPLSGPIPSLDSATLQPGDLAVTHSGVHLLVSLGGHLWIQADPGQGAVITLNSTTSTNGWLKSPVTVHRWTLLHPAPEAPAPPPHP